jgi:hypothetical protein
LDGRMLRAGDARGRFGGGICCEVLRDEVIDAFEVSRGEEASGRGDGGTELRSGAMILAVCYCLSIGIGFLASPTIEL